MFHHPDEQCKDGYRGALCLACAKDYVFRNNKCDKCEGGADIVSAFMAMLSITLFVFLVTLVCFLLVPSNKSARKGKRLFGQVKIIVAFLQILAAMPNVFDNVPWPKDFIQFTIPLNFVNLDFLSAFMETTCKLAVPFLDQFVLHMILPVLLLIAVIASYLTSRCCIKSKDKLERGKALRSQILILGVLLMYPGLSTKIFSVFRCKTIVGVDDGQVLVADFAVRCFSLYHMMYVTAAVACVGVYVIGLPGSMFLALWRHRKHLHDENAEHHDVVKESLGGLYQQYEPEYWWFEMVVVLQKSEWYSYRLVHSSFLYVQISC